MPKTDRVVIDPLIERLDKEPPSLAEVESTTPLKLVYKTRQMIDIEQANAGRDIRWILLEGFVKHGSQSALAETLGVTQPTIDNWFEMLGLSLTYRPVVSIDGQQIDWDSKPLAA